ncbi:MAG TPA: type II toxin-antitoxin system VapB family antitoxin [Iamia sp.]|jgi:antitoxin VapB|nr:type II toxin-antitoxin system VapB family antitoxin [Iamia sp.]
MALSIKSDEADALARELSRLTGESLTDTVTESLRQRLDRERRIGGDPVGDAIARARALLGDVPPGIDAARSADFLYDEHGLPASW